MPSDSITNWLPRDMMDRYGGMGGGASTPNRVPTSPGNSGTGMPDPFRLIQNEGGVSQGGIRRGEFSALATMPYDLMGQYRDISERGIYGDEGISDIMNSIRSSQRASTQQRTRAMQRGLQRTMGRRLGSRSGAISSMLANKAFGIHGAQESQRANILAGLKERNYQSKSGVGLENIQAIMQFLQQRYGERWWENMDKDSGDDGGVLGTIGGALGSVSDIAAMIPGPQQPIAAGASAARRFSGVG